VAEIVVTTASDWAHRWTLQFCRQAAWTAQLARANGFDAGRRNLVAVRGGRSDIVSAITRAAAAAGRDGRVLYNIGHGNGGRTGANVMFSNDGTFTVNAAIVNDGITLNIGGVTTHQSLNEGEQELRESFMRIGAALQHAGVAEFVFLVCGLGANPTFMGQIKAAWGGAIRISGYNDGVVLEGDTRQGDASYPRIRLTSFATAVRSMIPATAPGTAPPQVRHHAAGSKSRRAWSRSEAPDRHSAALISRSAALRASSVISAPASIRAISSRRRSAATSVTLVATRFPRASVSLLMT
jgi:hypothetical protein